MEAKRGWQRGDIKGKMILLPFDKIYTRVLRFAIDGARIEVSKGIDMRMTGSGNTKGKEV